jgi:pantetheine-phosphate adenylyltransferase
MRNIRGEENTMTRAAIYAGTFDPVTLGHMDIILRAAEIFEQVILAVAVETPKDTMFSIHERLAMARIVVKPLPNVQVESFTGLLVAYAKARRVHVLLRGLRAYSDFEYEFQMALTNRKLAPDIETLFMMPNEIHSYVSSSTVREAARLGGNTSDFVPRVVYRAICRKVKPRR